MEILLVPPMEISIQGPPLGSLGRHAMVVIEIVRPGARTADLDPRSRRQPI